MRPPTRQRDEEPGRTHHRDDACRLEFGEHREHGDEEQKGDFECEARDGEPARRRRLQRRDPAQRRLAGSGSGSQPWRRSSPPAASRRTSDLSSATSSSQGAQLASDVVGPRPFGSLSLGHALRIRAIASSPRACTAARRSSTEPSGAGSARGIPSGSTAETRRSSGAAPPPDRSATQRRAGLPRRATAAAASAPGPRSQRCRPSRRALFASPPMLQATPLLPLRGLPASPRGARSRASHCRRGRFRPKEGDKGT